MSYTQEKNKLISYRICRVRCKCCGDILEYINKSKNDNFDGMLVCSCGKVSLDPSAVMYRVIGSPSDYEDLSEKWD